MARPCAHACWQDLGRDDVIRYRGVPNAFQCSFSSAGREFGWSWCLCEWDKPMRQLLLLRSRHVPLRDRANRFCLVSRPLAILLEGKQRLLELWDPERPAFVIPNAPRPGRVSEQRSLDHECREMAWPRWRSWRQVRSSNYAVMYVTSHRFEGLDVFLHCGLPARTSVS